MTNAQDPTAKPYKPVDTDLVDDLEHYALEKIRVTINYRDHTGERQELRGLIQKVYTENHEEFLTMVGGRTLRLDQVESAAPHVQHT